MKTIGVCFEIHVRLKERLLVICLSQPSGSVFWRWNTNAIKYIKDVKFIDYIRIKYKCEYFMKVYSDNLWMLTSMTNMQIRYKINISKVIA